MNSEQWSVNSGQWTVNSGQWTVNSGQWTVDRELLWMDWPSDLLCRWAFFVFVGVVGHSLLVHARRAFREKLEQEFLLSHSRTKRWSMNGAR